MRWADSDPSPSGAAAFARGVLVQHHQVDVAGIIQLAAAEFAERQHDEPRRLAVAAIARGLLLADLPHGKVDRRLDDRVGHVGNLPRDLCHGVILHDVAVGDAERLAALESAERSQHFVLAAQGADVGDQFLDQHVASDRPAAGHPQQVVALGIAAELIGQGLAMAEQHQERRQGGAVALEQRRRGERAAARENVALQVVERHVRIGEPRSRGGELIAQGGQEIERHARRREADQIRVGGAGVGKPERSQPRIGFSGLVEKGTQALGRHHQLQHLQPTRRGRSAQPRSTPSRDCTSKERLPPRPRSNLFSQLRGGESTIGVEPPRAASQVIGQSSQALPRSRPAATPAIPADQAARSTRLRRQWRRAAR